MTNITSNYSNLLIKSESLRKSQLELNTSLKSRKLNLDNIYKSQLLH